MHNEIISFGLIDNQLKSLASRYPIREAVSEKALRILHEHNLIAECGLEVARKMGLSNRLCIKGYPENLYPFKGGAGHIGIPENIPIYGTAEFRRETFIVHIQTFVVRDYRSFVYVMAHELSHVVLHSTRDTLRKSEVATDLFAIISGFGDIMQSHSKDNGYTLGYVCGEYLEYAVQMVKKIRRSR